MLLKSNYRYVDIISMILTIILAQPIGKGFLGLYIDLDNIIFSMLAAILFVIVLYYLIYFIISFIRIFILKNWLKNKKQ
ncbi:hypothetical protein GCM10011346_16460 [Oceanobacillus neutriphilus]|uniref:Uncharacterized protein n=1 Tax=Oceanobacillus neutriphilus TaxID=531815 RepID=A0ABQ2NSN0_9BACI|nr:hypothetical protein GCM10011346_16460 [Oceanobacillus neutriphilus]